MTLQHEVPSGRRSTRGAKSQRSVNGQTHRSGNGQTHRSGNGQSEDRPLSDEDRRLIVDQAIMLLEGFYVHLPLKRTMYAVDPVQRLRLLRRRLGHFANDEQFHAEMIDIFNSLRDQHTLYYLPGRSGFAATLPFTVEAFGEPEARRYLVTKVKEEFVSPNPSFGAGVEVKSWNGVPIRRAAEIAGAATPGTNRDARHALGLARLTQRGLDVT